MAVRGRASLAVQQRDILRDEVRALKAERREENEQVAHLSRYLWRNLPVNTPQRAVAARIVKLTERRASDPKDAA